MCVAGSFGFAALGTGADALAAGSQTRVRYWNLFSGGDGYNMTAMLDAFRGATPDIAVKDSTLQWGNPYDTKRAMAAAGSRAPDLSVKALTSGTTDTWNAIDPGVIRADGRLWMAFGSYWTGVRMVELDPATGKSVPGATVHHLATRPDAPYAVEGPYLLRHSHCYYLFASYDACCAGVNSTYKIRVGRSANVTGPYADSAGTPLLAGGGDLLLAGHGRYVGTGGESVFRDRGRDVLAYHYYDAEEAGSPKLGLNTLRWTSDGRPVVR